ncbi:NAD(P)-dependent dehydrogenase (short-subunit alcohol dehydrogenase family) [Alkalibacillus filiformis]|uniref:NAD(P)-dependent dehydrogenase (Short-subunit alcohol dehydrogenase family) n=1 Tax=Alkalibacillus filiformis TaxID=200990 RepID=A0ABU0DT43_9BACI|nr:SDR family NAD(P)-dependent oxidoreductase [Alkalibacillus filiformis]MDQ0351355.1 NAD(P)-dependent dehydrogenase (short-subunit alcohol dehydrogenase family) [Alkalibacillus filiformis]
MSFNGKSVVITGGAGGIGIASAKQFLDEGAKVLLVDLNEEALVSAKQELGEQVFTYAANVAKEEEVKGYVQYAKEQLGSIDVFFNNAGIDGKFGLITEQQADDLDAVLNVNVKGVFYGLKHVIPVMTENGGGAIVNTSSVAGLIGSPGMSPYIASKHAVIGLTKTAALEGVDQGIRVNSVCPAPVDTEMMRSIESGMNPEDSESAKEQQASAIPMGRYAEAEEIANLVTFLASDKASYINSSHYTIDGGLNPN